LSKLRIYHECFDFLLQLYVCQYVERENCIYKLVVYCMPIRRGNYLKSRRKNKLKESFTEVVSFLIRRVHGVKHDVLSSC